MSFSLRISNWTLRTLIFSWLTRQVSSMSWNFNLSSPISKMLHPPNNFKAQLSNCKVSTIWQHPRSNPWRGSTTDSWKSEICGRFKCLKRIIKSKSWKTHLAFIRTYSWVSSERSRTWPPNWPTSRNSWTRQRLKWTTSSPYLLRSTKSSFRSKGKTWCSKKC